MENTVKATIETRLSDAFLLAHLSVENESASHNVPAGSETHFKVVLVADAFAGMSRLSRHRQVNEVLAEQLAGPVHALSVHAYSPTEWRERFGHAPLSPPCAGGAAESSP